MNPHRAKVVTDGLGNYRGMCIEGGCDWSAHTRSYSDAAVAGVRHQLDHANDREIRRRTDWTEPMEDT